MELVLEPVERLALAKAGIPGLTPVHPGVDMPVEMAGVAGVVDDVSAQLRRQRVIPGLGEERAAILPQAGGPIPFKSVQGELPAAGFIAKPGDVAANFLREIDIRQEDLVVVIHQLAHGDAWRVGRGGRAPGPALAAEQPPGRRRRDRVVAD